MIELIIKNWQMIAAPLLPALGYLAGTRFEKAKTKNVELENLTNVRAIEKALVKEMEDRIEKLVKINNELENLLIEQAAKLRRCALECGKINFK